MHIVILVNKEKSLQGIMNATVRNRNYIMVLKRNMGKTKFTIVSRAPKIHAYNHISEHVQKTKHLPRKLNRRKFRRRK